MAVEKFSVLSQVLFFAVVPFYHFYGLNMLVQRPVMQEREL
jgi:hypothetical protein